MVPWKQMVLALLAGFIIVLSVPPVFGGTALSTCFDAVVKVYPVDPILSVAETVDGGYVFSGSNVSADTGRKEMLLVRTNAGAMILWTARYTCPGNCEADSVVQTLDGGYAVLGGTTMPAGNTAVVLIKADAQGKEAWRHMFRPSGNQYGRVVRQHRDGGYAVLSSMSSIPTGMPGRGVPQGTGPCLSTLYRTDRTGKEVWNRSFGSSGESCLVTMEVSHDGGTMLGGSTSVKGAGGSDMYLVKVDNVGNLMWDKTFGDITDETGRTLTQTKDHNILFAGVVLDPVKNTTTPYVAKIDLSGTVLWSKTYSSESDPEYQGLLTTLANGVTVSDPPSESRYTIPEDTVSPTSETVTATPTATVTMTGTSVTKTVHSVPTYHAETAVAPPPVTPSPPQKTTTAALPFSPFLPAVAFVASAFLLAVRKR